MEPSLHEFRWKTPGSFFVLIHESVRGKFTKLVAENQAQGYQPIWESFRIDPTNGALVLVLERKKLPEEIFEANPT